MSFLLSIVFLLLLQSSFAAENPIPEGKDSLNREFTAAQFSRLSFEVIESLCVTSDFLIKAIVSVLMERV